jgi:hypothetical protein
MSGTDSEWKDWEVQRLAGDDMLLPCRVFGFQPGMAAAIFQENFDDGEGQEEARVI